MRCFVDADRVLEVNELRVDGAVLKVRKAAVKEIDMSMLQDASGKSCKYNISSCYCHFDCYIAKVIYFCMFSVKG